MDRIEKLLSERKKQNLLRRLRHARLRKEGKIYFGNNEYFDFSSNDYLGLAEHPALKEASKKAIEKFGTGSAASRLLSGSLEIHHQLEEKTAFLKEKENALVFNSGYQANIGIISSLFKTGDAVFCDKLSHASITDGILLCGARLFRFRHNDINHLESLLKKTVGKFKDRLIVTETIFSMEGDRPPLKQIVELKEKYNCKILTDEAHATGIFGENGSGVVAEENLSSKIDFIMGTFGKALGSFGAYIACSNRIKEYLINTSHSFIYSTALPPSVIAANLAALELLKKEPFRRKTLLENAKYFRTALKSKGLQAGGASQIIPLIVGKTEQTIALSEQLQKQNYWALPIRPPTVPPGQSRIRFSLTYHHNKEILQDLAERIAKITYV